MSLPSIRRILGECNLLEESVEDPELRALRGAILIEDAFNIVLSDEQLSVDLWGEPAALRQLLATFADHD